MSLRIYGKLPGGDRLARIKASPNYRGGAFQNLSPTNAMAEDAGFFAVMKEFLNKPANVSPNGLVPHQRSDLKLLPKHATSLVWFGHSSYLMQINSFRILVDPVFSGNAAPLSFMVKAFKGSDVYKPEDFPEIDLLLLTHDHYDHLDYKTVVQLKHQVKQVVCTLGVASHLQHWGFSPDRMIELDWWEEWQHAALRITSVPGRHFSGRGVKRGQSLWGGFVLQTPSHQILVGGDSGYDKHFKTLGERFGVFDLAILEAGQYNKAWRHIHMMPEETVQAAIDLQAKVLFPVHWGKFALAMHPWDEPIRRVVRAAESKQLPLIHPMIGQAVTLGEEQSFVRWWENC